MRRQAKNIVLKNKINFDCPNTDYEQMIHMTFSLCLLKLFANYKFIVNEFIDNVFQHGKLNIFMFQLTILNASS